MSNIGELLLDRLSFTFSTLRCFGDDCLITLTGEGDWDAFFGIESFTIYSLIL